MGRPSNKEIGLGYLGEEYQTQLVKCLIEDYTFFAKLNPVLDQNKFTASSLRRIVGKMKDIYSANGHVPTYSDIKNYIKYSERDNITVQEMIAVIDKIMSMDNFDMLIVEDIAMDFFKQQNLSMVLMTATDMVKKGNIKYNVIEKMLQDALEINNLEDTSFRLFENINDDLSENNRKTIPTGASALDNTLGGGLAKGELGIIIAPLGVGKTSATTGFAANAAICKNSDNNYSGYKVLHLFFEDMETSIRRKYYGFVTDIDASTLSWPENRQIALDILSKDTDINRMLKNNIVLNRWESGEKSASDVESEIKKQMACGFKPDLVIVDYFECLKPEPRTEHTESEWSREGVTMRKLERIAHKYDVALWVPIQGTKDSIGAEYVGVMHGGGSVKKTQIGHIVITFAQTDEQKVAGLMNLFIGKFRGGKINRNKFFGVHFNNGTCKFDFTNEVEDALGDEFENNSIRTAVSVRNSQRNK